MGYKGREGTVPNVTNLRIMKENPAQAKKLNLKDDICTCCPCPWMTSQQTDGRTDVGCLGKVKSHGWLWVYYTGHNHNKALW